MPFLPEKCIFLKKMAIWPPAQCSTAPMSRNFFSGRKFYTNFWSEKSGHCWAKMSRPFWLFSILPRSAHFFRFKNWCKITSRKKSSLTLALCCAELGVKLPFFSKKCFFRAEKCIFSKSSFYTKMFSGPKYSFSVRQKKFFAVWKKFNIFHHS